MLWLKKVFAKLLNIANLVRGHKSKTTYINAHETLTMNSKDDIKIDEIQTKIKHLIKTDLKTSNAFIQQFKAEGARVYKTNLTHLMLKLTQKEEGLILPQNSIEALMLNFVFELCANKKLHISFTQAPIFAAKPSSCELSMLIYSYYRLCGFKDGVTGFEAHSQSKLNKILSSKKMNITKISMDELITLEEATAKDKQALDFSLELAEQINNTKLEKIQQTGGLKV